MSKATFRSGNDVLDGLLEEAQRRFLEPAIPKQLSIGVSTVNRVLAEAN
ncbi:MAG: hypothetical protein HON65_15970 [Rhodospirillales bacterium]|nr:hypothetical protein [Rhodospirillales bacterium]